MEILFLLIPVSLLLVGVVAWILHWAVRSGQYEDLERPRHDILLDDDRPPAPEDRDPDAPGT